MQLSKHTIKKLAEMICGGHGSDNGFKWPNFIYRSGPELTDFFVDECGLPYKHAGTRITWVMNVLTEINEIESSNSQFSADHKISNVIISLLESIKRKQFTTYQEAIKDIDNILSDSRLGIQYNEGYYTFIMKTEENNSPIITFHGSETQSKDKFKQQFPFGLPFGWSTKPDFDILAEKGTQRSGFSIKNGIWVLTEEVYPNFTFQKLEKMCGIDHDANENFKRALINMNQTKSEKLFFTSYGKRFNIANAEVPLLIPQAWIQWHSLSKKELRGVQSIHANEPCRIDLVAFWNNNRYAILVDDISHYAKKDNTEIWIANEEEYSKSLQEDRKLRKEGWNVFRLSNWETRNESMLQEILSDLREFIGF